MISLRSKVIAYRQEPSDKILTHWSSQDSVLMGSLLRYNLQKYVLRKELD